MSDLTPLTHLAGRLGGASDDLTVALQQVEAQINRLHLGVTAWLDEPLLHDDDDGAWQLGYGRGWEGWGFLVRRAGMAPMRLGRARRPLRLAAVALLPAVVQALDAAATQLARDLEQATRELTEALALFQARQEPPGATISRRPLPPR